jgi:hypothetical protein
MPTRRELIRLAKTLTALAYTPYKPEKPPTFEEWEQQREHRAEWKRQEQLRRQTTLTPERTKLLFHWLVTGRRFHLETDKFEVQRVGGELRFTAIPGDLVDVKLLEVLRVFSDRFTLCPVCRHGFFRFDKAQYCSRPCSNTGRRQQYKAKLKAAKAPAAPRLLSRIPARPGLSDAEIEAVLTQVRPYLVRQIIYERLSGPRGEAAINFALADMWRAMKNGTVPMYPKAYALKCLKRAAMRV